MIERIASIDFLVTESEAEALLAEQSFIKRHRPQFNIRLRDDKSYPYIGISLDEEFPRVYFTRERHRSQRLYFGPYSSAKRVRETLDLLGRLFQYRTCEGPEPGRRSGVPCLDYYIKRCAAPCVGYVDREEYRRGIDAIVAFLSGRYRDVERDLERKMAEAAAAEEFERAAVFRDRLEAVRSLMERRSVAGESLDSADLIAVAVEGAEANAQVFQVRDGVLAERHGFYLANEAERDEAEVTEEFLAQYYSAAPSIPRLIVVGPALSRARRAGRRGALRRGAAGRSRCGSPSAARSGACASSPSATRCSALAQDKLRQERRRAQRVDALSALQDALGLESLPVRVEGYDISNIGGRAHGRIDGRVPGRRPAQGRLPALPDPGRPPQRRRGPDDFACDGGGALAARLAAARAVGSLAARRRARRELRRGPRPDRDRRRQGPALGRDEGAGAADRARHRGDRAGEAARGGLPAGARGAARDPADSEGLRLLQRVRDEAHRFALDHHRSRRDKAMTGSLLDELRGVGPKRKRALLEHFGSPERLVAASREELEAVPGIPGKLARDIHRQLNKAG